MEGQRACYRLAIIKMNCQVYEGILLCRMFQTHQLNQAFFEQRREIHRNSHVLRSGRTGMPNEEGFVLDHVVGDPELIGQRDSYFSQTACCV